MFAAETRAEHLDHLRGTLYGVLAQTDTSTKHRESAQKLVDGLLETLSTSDWQVWQVSHALTQTKHGEVGSSSFSQHSLEFWHRILLVEGGSRSECE